METIIHCINDEETFYMWLIRAGEANEKAIALSFSAKHAKVLHTLPNHGSSLEITIVWYCRQHSRLLKLSLKGEFFSSPKQLMCCDKNVVNEQLQKYTKINSIYFL